jgi:hypothetical protein
MDKLSRKLVFSFGKYVPWGFNVEPFMMEILPDQSFSYAFEKINSKQFLNHDYEFNETEKELIKTTELISIKNIEKTFKKEKVKEKDFWKQYEEDDKVKRTINAYIDTKLSFILQKLIGETIYIRYKASDHPALIKVNLHKNAADVVYNFHKHEEGLQYFITVQHQEKKLKLNKFANAAILCNNPCYLLLGNKVLHFDDRTDGNKLLPFFNKDAVLVNEKMLTKYVQSFVLPSFRKFKTETEGFNITSIDNNPTGILDLSQHLDGEMGINLTFKYGQRTYKPDEEKLTTVLLPDPEKPFDLIKIERNAGAEKELIKLLENEKLKHNKNGYFDLTLKGKKAELDDVIAVFIKLEKLNIFKINAQWKGNTFNTSEPNLNIKIDQTDDWFDVNAIIKVGKFEIPFIRLKDNILKNNPNFKLPDGSIMIIPEEWFVRAHDFFLFSEVNGDSIKLAKHHSSILEDNPLFGKEKGISLENSKKKIYSSNELKSFELPKNIEANLRPYQLEGYNWLLNLSENKFGACLADDMGLGKTIQVIAVLLKHYENAAPVEKYQATAQLSLFDLMEEEEESEILETKAPSIIVLSPSLIHNWASELSKFAPSLKVGTYLSNSRSKTLHKFNQYQIILTTYGVVRNDIDLLKEELFDYIILDESQLIKNARSLAFQAVKKLRGRNKIVLTGTPVENSLTDLWSQLTFLNPGLLGAYRFFKDEFVNPIEKQGNAEQLDKLKKIISPFILRRTKEEVAKDLPSLTERILYCEMTDEQTKLYEKVKSFYRNQIIESISNVGIQKSQITILKGLTELRLIANHPKLKGEDIDSGKFDEVMSRLKMLLQENRKVLVFSQFVKHLELFRSQLETDNVPYSWLTGSVRNRKEVIAEFKKAKGAHVFFISLKAGGVGLNLTDSDQVFILDPWWNPKVEEQAIARAHRIGQDQKVFSYKFISKGSIEEKILALQKRKSILAADLINNNPFRALNEQEIQQLFD